MHGGNAEVAPTGFYERDELRAGNRIAGPAIVEQYDSTTIIPPGFTAEIDARGNIVIDCPRVRRDGPRPGSVDSDPHARDRRCVPSIAKEMAGVLFRMAYSSIIRESEDLGAGIFDRDGNVLAESDSTPMHMGAMPNIVRRVLRISATTFTTATSSSTTTRTSGHRIPRCRDRDPNLLGGRARRRSPARPRTCLTSAAPFRDWRSTSWTIGARGTSIGL